MVWFAINYVLFESSFLPEKRFNLEKFKSLYSFRPLKVDLSNKNSVGIPMLPENTGTPSRRLRLGNISITNCLEQKELENSSSSR